MKDCREIQWNGLKGLLSGMVLGILSCDVFERRTSTGSEPFPILIGFNVTKFVLPSVFTLSETIWPKMCSKSRLKSAKSLLPADVRGSKTSLLKLPIYEPLTSPFMPFPLHGGKGRVATPTSVTQHSRGVNRFFLAFLHPLYWTIRS